jgi:YidC/Oxa1 family membrane protein insertase
MIEVFDGFFAGIAWILSWFYSIWPSYGGAIILLTLSVMVVMTPLTLKGTRSMMAMQRLQPEMKRIQERHKDDREKLNEEMLKFYKENNVNPVGGCLPLVLQMPVFLVLFRVLQGLTRSVSDIGIQFGYSTGQVDAGEALATAPADVTIQPFDPAYLDQSSQFYDDLAGSYEMDWLGLDLADSASDALAGGLVHALPYIALIGIVALSGWYQQKQTQARNSSEPNSQQQMIGRVMLIFLPAISFGLPAGIVLYFVVSNLWRIGQQAYITRSMFSDEIATPNKGGGSGKDNSKDNGKDNGKVKNPDAKKGDGAKEAAGASKDSKGSGSAKGGSKSQNAKKNTGSSGSKSSKSSASKNRNKSRKKTYTSDPKAKKGGQNELVAEPRPRKKRRR